MPDYTIVPKVDTTQEFIEIANDFSNPLDIVREAISNAFDAGASKIEIYFSALTEYGNRVLEIRIKDDGAGMNKEELQAFFDLGNSPKRDNIKVIGEKGHGTKVYFNSSEIQVTTIKEGTLLHAKMLNPYQKLFDRQIPEVQVHETLNVEISNGTEIIIKGYNRNQCARFTHAELKDHIMWFTKFGSFEKEFGINADDNTILILKGLDADAPEEIKFGHFFPADSPCPDALFDKYKVSAPDYYCKKIVKTGVLKNFPDIKYHAVFCIEGNKVKQQYNQMLRRSGKPRIPGDYTVQERYGLWLCKDFIPVQNKNGWFIYKGSEYTKFHAFINCQKLRLTANRGSVENTPAEFLEDIKTVVVQIYEDIVESNDWQNISWLEEEAEAYRSTETEKKNFEMRINNANKANIAKYKESVLVEPQRESGVYTLVVQLSTLMPDLFPFTIVDYDTHQGIDVIVKGRSDNPVHQSKLFYLEFKHTLHNTQFNHSFQNTHSIVCWDIELKHDETIRDLNEETRKLQIARPQRDGEQTKYFLDHQRAERKIEIFVLKDYLKEKLGIEFRPRTADSLV